MFKLFSRNKVNINSVQIPDSGWNLEKTEKSLKQWINDEQTVGLSINYFELEPDLPTIVNIDELRKFYRKQLTPVEGGIIEINKFDLKGYDCIRTIFKFPQKPQGMTYLASLTIPFGRCSYVVKLQAPEIGITGMRDNIVASKLQKEGKISIGENGYEGWFIDPYDPDIKEGTRMNLSEEEKYDQDFPKHPLSRVRRLLKELELGIGFSDELDKIERFKK